MSQIASTVQAPPTEPSRSRAMRAGLPILVVAVAGFLSGPWLVGFATRAWEDFFFPALVQMSQSGLRWCF